ncbi:MAG: MATE family efflux transporter [Deltaproteobacteria bacterium]|jgi:MATE family multidrug resistance protein|nr:MATE family efflux transporter [Deltaproteobacteria bacterium]
MQKVSSREIWNLTWPQVLMMLFQFLVGFTNVWVAGRIQGDVQAALGVAVQCFFLLMVVGISIANAAVSTMSQSLGAGRPLRAKRYLGLVINLGGVLCLITLLIGYFLRHQLMYLLQVPDSILDLTLHLWLFYLAGTPFQYAIAFSAAVFRAHKKVRIPLYTGMVVCAANFAGSFGLGLGRFGLPDLGVDGLALSALISSGAGAIYVFYMLVRHGYLSRRSFAALRWQLGAAGYLIKVALPAGGNQFSWQLGQLAIIGVTASLPWDNVNAMAGLTAGIRIESILFLPAIAFSMTGTILVGHCLGSGDKEEARRVGLKVLAVGCGIMTLVALLLWPWVDELAAFMSPTSPAVQPQTISYVKINLFATPFTVGSMILGGLLTGAGASIYPFVIYSAATWLVRLPVAWWLGHIVWQSSSGIFASMLISQIVQCSIILYVFLRCDWARFSMYRTKPKARTA